jgi:hypothetical protein
MRLWQRLSAILIVLVMVGGQAGVCAGWQPTAKARMDCCSQGTDCPMQHGRDHSTASSFTQSDADRCCASSERSHSTQQASASLVAVIARLRDYITLSAPPAPRLLRRGTTQLPPDLHHDVSTHVLFSVFVI